MAYIHNWILLSHREKQNYVIYKKMNEVGDLYVKWNKSNSEGLSYVKAREEKGKESWGGSHGDLKEISKRKGTGGGCGEGGRRVGEW